MKRATLLTLLALSLAAAPAVARDNGTVRPPSAGPNGPLSSADRNHDGWVTRAEIEDFMRDGEYRRYGLVQYFEMLDLNHDGVLTAPERHRAKPANTFDDVDFNGDDLVSKAEVEQQVGDRLYRKIGTEAFFELLDTNHDDRLSPAEILKAHETGQLPWG